MNKIVNNKYLDALLKTMLFSAIIHMILLFIYIGISGKFYLANYFNILDLDLFSPKFIEGAGSLILSGVVVLGIYIFFLFKRDS